MGLGAELLQANLIQAKLSDIHINIYVCMLIGVRYINKYVYIYNMIIEIANVSSFDRI